MDWYIVLLACLGLLILAVAWLPAYLRQLPLSLPIICVGFGYALFSIPGTGAGPNPLDHPDLAERLTELVLIVSLTGAGLRLNRHLGWHSWNTTWRLLGISMPLSIAGIGLLGWWGLGLAPAAALLLGAVLAPTDPVLASEVQVGPPREPDKDEVRFGLTSESGLNDGLAFPFASLALAIAAHGATPGRWTLEWLAIDVGWQVAGGIATGMLAGRGLGLAIFRYVDEAGDNLVSLGIAFLVYGLAGVVGVNGFLAVFVAALTIRRWEGSHRYRERLHRFAEQVERLLMMVLLVLFGGAIAGGMLATLTWQAALLGLVFLLVVRPVAGLLGLAGCGRPTKERMAVSFFGIRGVGSLYYIALAYNTSELAAHAEPLYPLVGFTVLGSIVLHGVTATPAMRYLARSRH